MKRYLTTEYLSEISEIFDYSKVLELFWKLFYDEAYEDISCIAKMIELDCTAFPLLTQNQKKYIINKYYYGSSLTHLPTVKSFRGESFLRIPDSCKTEGDYRKVFLVLRYFPPNPIKFTLCKKILKNIKHNKYLSTNQKNKLLELLNTVFELDIEKIIMRLNI